MEPYEILGKWFNQYVEAFSGGEFSGSCVIDGSVSFRVSKNKKTMMTIRNNSDIKVHNGMDMDIVEIISKKALMLLRFNKTNRNKEKRSR